MKVQCLNCGKTFNAKPSQIKRGRGKFCSKKCYAEFQSKHMKRENHHNWKRVKRTCLNCGKEFWVEAWRLKQGEKEGKKRGLFCSVKCLGEYHKGENNPFWKGGDYPYSERELFQSSTEWKKISQVVRKRDGYRCYLCGRRSNLVVHHIREWAKYPQERLDPTNLVTLCVSCHNLIHASDKIWEFMGVDLDIEPTLRMPDIEMT